MLFQGLLFLVKFKMLRRRFLSAIRTHKKDVKVKRGILCSGCARARQKREMIRWPRRELRLAKFAFDLLSHRCPGIICIRKGWWRSQILPILFLLWHFILAQHIYSLSAPLGILASDRREREERVYIGYWLSMSHR